MEFKIISDMIPGNSRDGYRRNLGIDLGEYGKGSGENPGKDVGSIWGSSPWES